MKRLLCICATLLLTFSSLGTCAQVEKEKDSAGNNTHKIFYALHFGIASDYASGPVVHMGYYKAEDKYSYPLIAAVESFSIVSAAFEGKYNLKEFGNDASVSLGMPLLLSISSVSILGSFHQSDAGIGCLKAPLILQYNSGNFSTYDTFKKKGFSLGLGIQYTIAPLIWLKDTTNGEVKTGWLNPVISASIVTRRNDKISDNRIIRLLVGLNPKSVQYDAYESSSFSGPHGLINKSILSMLSLSLTYGFTLGY